MPSVALHHFAIPIVSSGKTLGSDDKHDRCKQVHRVSLMHLKASTSTSNDRSKEIFMEGASNDL